MGKASDILDLYLPDMNELSDKQYHWVKVAMQDYAKRMCKEQKQLCAETIPEPFFQAKILRADEPDFDLV